MGHEPGTEAGIPARSEALPLLLVDVDGVLSLWGFSPDERPEGVWMAVDGLPHLLSTRSAGRVRDVSRFEPRWCTGWEERADEHLPALLGLGPWGHLSFARPGRGSLLGHWKLAAIDAAAGDRPLAWVDDAFNDACWAWPPPGPLRRSSCPPTRPSV